VAGIGIRPVRTPMNGFNAKGKKNRANEGRQWVSKPLHVNSNLQRFLQQSQSRTNSVREMVSKR